MELLIQKVDQKAVVPTKAYDTDSGFDLYAINFKEFWERGGTNYERKRDEKYIKDRMIDNLDGRLPIGSQERVLIDTGIMATVGKGYEIQIRSRSGLALNQGLSVLNSPGTCNEGYRNTICVILQNNSGMTQKIKIGDRIAQLVVAKVELPEIKVVETLPASERGPAGFGSTGR